MGVIKDNYKESKKYSNTIISDVEKVLDDNGIKYSINKKKTEIVVNQENQTKESVFKNIFSTIGLPKMIFLTLIDITEVSGKIYIRQKTK